MLGIDAQQPEGESDAALLGGRIRALSLPLALRPKEWLGLFEGHEIRVATRGLLPARLYIDGELRDKRSPVVCVDRSVPLLSGGLPAARSEVTIGYVYRRGLWPMQPEVRVRGTMVPMNPIMNPYDER